MALPDLEREGLVSLFRSLQTLGEGGAGGLSPEVLPLGLLPRLDAPLPRRPRAVLFDIYGTLVSSGAGGLHEGRGGGEKAAMPPHGFASLAGLDGPDCPFPLATVEGLLETLPRVIESARAALEGERQYPEIVVEEALAASFPALPRSLARKLVVAYEAVANPCAPMRGALWTIGLLAGRGIELGLVSNAQFYTPLLLEALYGSTPQALGFDEALSFYSFEIGHAKPGLELFRRAREGLAERGIAPAEAVVVGNSYANDVLPAAALGFKTVLFAGDPRSFRPGGAEGGGPPPDALVLELPDLAWVCMLA